MAVFKYIRLAVFIAFLAVGLLSLTVQAQAPGVTVLEVKGAINPVLADFIKDGIEESAEKGDAACIIRMDTPGGLDTAMRDIVVSITNARVPVVVYVAPSGGRAASAGVFITMSAHVAAMAPNTAIGAAHPVAVGGEEIDETMEEKVVNDAAAYIRSIAEARGRNADWAEQAVRESVSITEVEALEMNVIDLTASTLDDLLSQLNGRTVTLIDGSTVTLNTAGAAVNETGMNWIQDFLYAISDPTIAYILLSIGSLGIMAEIFNPGLIFPGIIGAISLLLAFYSLGTLPVNWTGVLLIILAFGLFIAEFFTSGFGLLFGGGLVAFIIGSLILFQGGAPVFQIDWWAIFTVIIIVACFVAFAAFKVAGTHRRQASTGREDLMGKKAVVRQSLSPEGTVFYKGELWSAISESGTISPGEEVIITGVDGLTLIVIKK
ncbi:MAG: nodulation protein NfeD, partial [Dehalococcoidales bacterium]|nr:nodulation protein NfeD [Dehalococcoidales bacterium]